MPYKRANDVSVAAAGDDSHLFSFSSDCMPMKPYITEVLVRALAVLLILASAILVIVSHTLPLASCQFYSESTGSSSFINVKLWRVETFGRQTWFEASSVSAARAFMIVSLVSSVTAAVLSLAQLVLRIRSESQRQRDDAKRHALRIEFYNQLGKYRVEHPERSAKVSRERHVRPLHSITDMTLEEEAEKSWEYAMLPYQLREVSRRVSDRNWGISNFSLLIISTLSLIISVSCFAHFYDQIIKEQLASHYDSGFWTAISALLISAGVAILLPITAATGMHICCAANLSPDDKNVDESNKDTE